MTELAISGISTRGRGVPTDSPFSAMIKDFDVPVSGAVDDMSKAYLGDCRTGNDDGLRCRLDFDMPSTGDGDHGFASWSQQRGPAEWDTLALTATQAIAGPGASISL